MADNKESSFINSNFTARERVLLYALICIIIVIGGIYFLIRPSLDKHDQAVVSLQQEQDLKIEMETSIANAEANRKDISEAKNSLAELSRNYYEPMLTEDVDILLASLAKKHRLTPKTLLMQPVVPYGFIVPERGGKDKSGSWDSMENVDGLPAEVGILIPVGGTEEEKDASKQEDADNTNTEDAKADEEKATEEKDDTSSVKDAASQLDDTSAEDTEKAEDDDTTKNKNLLQTPGGQTIWVATAFFSLEGDWANMVGLIDEISKTDGMYLMSFTKTDKEEDKKGLTTVFAKPQLNIAIQILMYQDELSENKMLSIPSKLIP